MTALITRLLDKDPATRPDVAAAFALVGDWTPPPTVEAPGRARPPAQDVQLGVEWVEHFAFVNERLRNGDINGDIAVVRGARTANAAEAVKAVRAGFEVSQNEYLAAGAREVHAVVSVATTVAPGSAEAAAAAAVAAARRADRSYGGGAAAAGAGVRAGVGSGVGAGVAGGASGRVKQQPLAATADGPPTVVFIADCSRSLAEPGRLEGVKAALRAGIDELPDGARFAVIAGRADSQAVYPEDGPPQPATKASRAAAKAAVNRLTAYGGREIGLWLSRAARMFALGAGPVRHAILVVNGRDEGLHPSRLAMTARACAGLFTADCLGLGDDWDVHEMRLVSEQLSGAVALVAEPEALPDAVRDATADAASKRVADVELSLWTPAGAVIRYVKQVDPVLRDLTDARLAGDAVRTVGYPTGAWGRRSGRTTFVWMWSRGLWGRRSWRRGCS
ncbi:hypothetical protein ACFQ9X_48115 [Catenulispora yoronensis]